MMRSAPSISTTGPAGPSSVRKYGSRSSSRAARSCSARSCPRTLAKTSCVVDAMYGGLRERRGERRRFAAGLQGVHRAPVPAACYLAAVGPPDPSGAAAVSQPADERVLQARRSAGVPRAPRRSRRRAHQRPDRRRLRRRARAGRGLRYRHVRLRRVRGRRRRRARPAGRRARLAGGPRALAHDRADGLHDERRVRRADRGLRARADDQAAVASAVLPAAPRAGGPREGDRPLHVGARDLRPREDPAGHLRARRAGGLQARRAAAPPAPPRPGEEHQGRLRRGLQHRLEAQLGLRAVLRHRPQALRRGAAARLRPQLVHGRREGRRDDRHRDHGARRQPDPEGHERPDPAVRLVPLPVSARQVHRSGARRLPRRQARVSAHWDRRSVLRGALRHGDRQGRRNGARWGGFSRRIEP